MEKLLKNLKNSGVLNSNKVYDAMKQKENYIIKKKYFI